MRTVGQHILKNQLSLFVPKYFHYFFHAGINGLLYFPGGQYFFQLQAQIAQNHGQSKVPQGPRIGVGFVVDSFRIVLPGKNVTIGAHRQRNGFFIAGSQGQILRIIVGVVLFVAAGALVYMMRVQPQPSETTIVQKVDLSGDVSLESLRCQSCDGALDRDAVEVRGGAIFINCPYCGATYQFEEEPKW